jgi:hypothetical protein
MSDIVIAINISFIYMGAYSIVLLHSSDLTLVVVTQSATYTKSTGSIIKDSYDVVALASSLSLFCFPRKIQVNINQYYARDTYNRALLHTSFCGSG